MITPCLCIGTQQYIHRDCLLRWTNAFPTTDRRNTHCGVCQTEYTVAVGGRTIAAATHSSSVIESGNRLFAAYVITVLLNTQVIVWFIIECASGIINSVWVHAGFAVSLLNGIAILFVPFHTTTTRHLKCVPHALECTSGVSTVIVSVVVWILDVGVMATAAIAFFSFVVALTVFLFALRDIRNLR